MNNKIFQRRQQCQNKLFKLFANTFDQENVVHDNDVASMKSFQLTLFCIEKSCVHR